MLAQIRAMRALPLFATAVVLATGVPALAADKAVGRYRLAGEHDAAGELFIHAGGRFEYALAEGALDEHAEGRWVRQGMVLVLTTVPKPVPPVFRLAPRSANAANAPTLRVTTPDGHGVAGVDFRIGFDSGDPIVDYTQYDGWTMPPDEHRIPRWIELAEPIYRIVSPRYAIDARESGTLNFTIVPNDIGVVDFDGTVVDVFADALLVHRREGEMRFVREAGES